MLCFFKKLDDGHSPEKEDCVSPLHSCCVLSFGFFYPCPKTSIRSFHSRLHNISEERRSHKTVWWSRPWVENARSGSEQSSMALHVQI